MKVGMRIIYREQVNGNIFPVLREARVTEVVKDGHLIKLNTELGNEFWVDWNLFGRYVEHTFPDETP